MNEQLDQHWKQLRRSKSNPDLLTHADLFDRKASKAAGKNVYHSPVLKIVDVTMGVVKSKETPNGEQMVCLHFEGIHRKLGLNSTNSSTIESLTGRGAPSQWVGFTIQLYVDPQAQYPAGKKGPAIRIRPKLPRGAPETSLPDVHESDRDRLTDEQAQRLGEDGGEHGDR